MRIGEEAQVPEELERNLALAFAEESKAAARNAAFALRAEQEGYSQVARLFRAVAEADGVHARRFLLLLRGKIGTTEENLRSALQGEARATEGYYPEMVRSARGASKAVKKAFAQSMKTDGEHAELFKGAIQEMQARAGTEYYVCQICGHVHEGAVPDRCPVCQAVPGRFKKVS